MSPEEQRYYDQIARQVDKFRNGFVASYIADTITPIVELLRNPPTANAALLLQGCIAKTTITCLEGGNYTAYMGVKLSDSLLDLVELAKLPVVERDWPQTRGAISIKYQSPIREYENYLKANAVAPTVKSNSKKRNLTEVTATETVESAAKKLSRFGSFAASVTEDASQLLTHVAELDQAAEAPSNVATVTTSPLHHLRTAT